MKKFLFSLVAAAVMSLGCASVAYADPPVSPVNGCTTFTDDYGTREICAPYYYSEGSVVYWDAHFGAWIGPRGYLRGGRWYRGYHPGYHGYYHHGYYGGHGGHGHR